MKFGILEDICNIHHMIYALCTNTGTPSHISERPPLKPRYATPANVMKSRKEHDKAVLVSIHELLIEASPHPLTNPK
jgi:hypothetical protein